MCQCSTICLEIVMSLLIFMIQICFRQLFTFFQHTPILEQASLKILKVRFFNRVENIVTKGQTAHFDKFHLFYFFSKNFLLQRRLSASSWGMVNIIYLV